MKASFFTNLMDKILRIDENDKKADLQFSSKVAAFGIAMAIVGIFSIIIAFCFAAWLALLFALLAFCASAFALLSYKFRRIHVLSKNEFEYTTLFGKKVLYRFDDIRAIKMDSDSHILVMKQGNLRIDRNAILSDRLKFLFNRELDRIYKENSARRNSHKTKKSFEFPLYRRKR